MICRYKVLFGTHNQALVFADIIESNGLGGLFEISPCKIYDSGVEQDLFDLSFFSTACCFKKIEYELDILELKSSSCFVSYQSVNMNPETERAIFDRYIKHSSQ